jgi:hypothetical protein
MNPVNSSFDPLFSDCADNEAFGNVKTNVSAFGGGSECAGSDYKNNNPYLRTWRSYLGWGVLKDVAKDNNVIFCAFNSTN